MASSRTPDTEMANHPFTEFVRSLAPGEEPQAAAFNKVWSELVEWLRQELRRRGLWLLPTSYLGVDGVESWADVPDALLELASEGYLFVFVDRLASLRAHVAEGRRIEALVRRSVRNFIHERQRQSDPLGSRIYALVTGAIDEARTVRELVAIPDGQVGFGSTIGFDDGFSDQDVIGRARLCSLVSDWGDQLLPKFVTTSGRGIRRVQIQLRALVAALEGRGVRAFRLNELVGCLRQDFRPRWAEILGGSLGLAGDDSDSQGVLNFLSTRSIPGRALEQDQGYRALIDCVERKLRSHPASPEENEHLSTLWRLLLRWAETGEVLLETGDERAGESRSIEVEPRGAIPSQREISGWLSISRDRLSSLYKILGHQIRSCQKDLGAIGAGSRSVKPMASDDPNWGSGGKAMDSEQRRASLLRLTAEALDRIETSVEKNGGRFPLAGGIFAFPAPESPADPKTSEPIGETFAEWIVLSETISENGTVVVVPADIDPLAGGDDVAFAGGSSSGALTLRTSLAFEAPARLFSERPPSRRLDDDQLALARAARERSLGRSPEWLDVVATELGPRYRSLLSRLADEVKAICRATTLEPVVEDVGSHPEVEAPEASDNVDDPNGRPVIKRQNAAQSWLMPLAATLALVGLGLGVWVVNLKQQLDHVRHPSLVIEAEGHVRLGEIQRAPIRLFLPEGADRASLYFTSTPDVFECNRARLEFLDIDGKVLDRVDAFDIPAGRVFSILVHRAFLERQPEFLRVFSVCPASEELAHEAELDIVFE